MISIMNKETGILNKTKAQVLESLKSRKISGKLCKQKIINYTDWAKDSEKILESIIGFFGPNERSIDEK